MNSEPIIAMLKKLVDEGNQLLDLGYEIQADLSSSAFHPVLDWLLKCNSFLANRYGKSSHIYKEFTHAYTLQMSINVLVSLAVSEIRNNEQRTIYDLPDSSECDKQINHLLENVLPPEQRVDASQLNQQIHEELACSDPNWEKITSLLSKCYFFGIPFGSEVALLVYSHYKAQKHL